MKLPIVSADAVKKSYIVSFGELMLRLSSPEYGKIMQTSQCEASFGGGEANVAVSLATFGCRTRYITGFPDNDIGQAALRLLRGYGIDVSHIAMKKNSRMGIYFIEKGANQRPSKVIYDRDNAAVNLLEKDDINWSEVFKDSCWYHVTGITPALSARAAARVMDSVRAASEHGVIISVDLNYRSKLWKYGVDPVTAMHALAEYADVLIGNEEDFQKSLGIRCDIAHTNGIDKEQYASLLKDVLAKYPRAKLAAVTMRESVSANHNRWSVCCSDRESCLFSKEYEIVDIVDRVGAGDSFSAGMIYGLMTCSTLQNALDFATAASCLKHSIQGDLNLTTKEEVYDLLKGDAGGRIQR